MLGALAKKIFGTANDRRLKTYAPNVKAINALEPQLEALTDDELTDRTVQFREQFASGKSLDDLLDPRLRHRPRSVQAHARPAPFRRSAHRRHGAA